MAVKVIDRFGNEQNWDWVIATYGDGVAVAPIVGDGYRVTQLTEREGGVAFTCTVLTADGGPVVGQQVAYTWPDGEQIEITNGSGTAEHSTGPGEGYDPNTMTGPASWQVRGVDQSETISGLGWLWGTQYRHLDVTVQYDTEQPDDLMAKLDAILAEIQQANVYLCRMAPTIDKGGQIVIHVK